MQPVQFLYLLILLTLAAAALHRLSGARRCRELRRLARELGMQYVTVDRFGLKAKVAGQLPVAGATEARVSDVMYVTEGERRRYVFTCEFGVGVVFAQRRKRRVLGFEEGISGVGLSEVQLRVAKEKGSLREQYRELVGDGRRIGAEL
jgi:hypothetical protein